MRHDRKQPTAEVEFVIACSLFTRACRAQRVGESGLGLQTSCAGSEGRFWRGQRDSGRVSGSCRSESNSNLVVSLRDVQPVVGGQRAKSSEISIPQRKASTAAHTHHHAHSFSPSLSSCTPLLSAARRIAQHSTRQLLFSLLQGGEACGLEVRDESNFGCNTRASGVVSALDPRATSQESARASERWLEP